jgi:hypothetical protein
MKIPMASKKAINANMRKAMRVLFSSFTNVPSPAAAADIQAGKRTSYAKK